VGRPARVRIPARYRWMADLLARAGATLRDSSDGVHTYDLGPELGGFLRRERVCITFRKRTGERDGVELASPGSWFHDQLLRYARERGRVAEGYLAPRDDVDREGLLRSRRRGFREIVDLRERRYGTLLVFTFRVSFYSELSEEQLQHVTFDCERGRAIRKPILRQLFLTRPEAPAEDFGAPRKPNIKKAFAAAWEVLENQVETRVRELQEKGQPYLEEKVAQVERYYRQLLAEEKRLLKSRASRRGQDESRGRIDLLKLEWERRVKEETERLKPQVVASLSAVGRVWVPLERWRCRVENGQGPETRDIWLDLARNETWEAPPSGNGTR